MCLAMNDDRLEPGERCASTSNRNFEGRQGTGGRTHATKAKGGPKHGNIWNARSGNRGGLEHFLPVLMTFGVHAGRISIEDVARVGALNTILLERGSEPHAVEARNSTRLCTPCST